MIIEISYAIIFSVIAILFALSITGKMSLGIGLVGMFVGFGIAWLIGPYSQIVMGPVGDAIAYGGIWTLAAILGTIHLASMIIMAVMVALNLMRSEGKITWA